MIQHTSKTSESGMTAVELLITLFVAAAFLIAGYQLFNVIIRDGGEIRSESTASNMAYGLLRQYADSVSNTCVQTTLLPAGVPTTLENLPEVTTYVYTDCPYGTSFSLSRLNAEVSYGFPVKTVKHSTYVDRSKGI